jgi:hypothetical protein
MTLLFTVEASGVRFCRCCILSGGGSMSTLISSIQSLKGVGAWNHLLLRGVKYLAIWLRHLLRTLCDGAEDRSSSRRTNVGSGVGALLGLIILPAFGCQYSSSVLEHKSLVYHGLEILEVTCFQSIGKSIIKSVEEPLCHTRFLSQNRMLIVCVPKNQVYTHTAQKMDTE